LGTQHGNRRATVGAGSVPLSRPAIVIAVVAVFRDLAE
jgi:hypothetical protein